MKLKIGFYIFCFAIMTSVLASCLNSDDPETYIPIDAQITAFSLKHDSFPALDSVVFTIDQFNGSIYNHDSMAYSTNINEKVKATITTGAAAILNITNIDQNDSTWIASGDSLDLSSPVHLKIYSYSGVIKYYWVKLNIHKVDPDSISYQQIESDESILHADETKTVYVAQTLYTYTKSNGAIKSYRSADGVNWAEITLNGFPADALLSEIQNTDAGLFVPTSSGKIYQSTDASSWLVANTEYPVKAFFGHTIKTQLQVAGMNLAVEKDGKTVFAFTPDFVNWVYGEQLPQNFPLTGFSAVKQLSMSLDRLTIIGGKDASGTMKNMVWSTSNGLHWAKISDNNQGLFPMMQGANAFIYDNMIYLLNGKLEDGTYNKVTYRSIDGGTTWKKAPEKTFFPENYTARYQASIVVDKDNYIYIVGGRQNEVLTDVWKGILNKLSFNQ